jgi:hypothetical protein
MLMDEFAAAQAALVQPLREALKNGPRWLVAVDLENMVELLSRRALASLSEDSATARVGTIAAYENRRTPTTEPTCRHYAT